MKIFGAIALPLLCQAAWSQVFDTPVTSSTPVASTAASTPLRPISAEERAKWVIKSTLGLTPLFTRSIESGLQTWTNSPKEYGSHWDGFGKREASKFGSSILSSSLEASIGSVWGEDPRYRRIGTGSGGRRVKYAIRMAFMAENKSGATLPAYARFIAVPSAQFLSNNWREPSELTPGGTAQRIGFSFIKRIGSNTLKEFAPDLRKRILRKP